MRKTGIMGGTFNPVHNAHLMIAETARCEYGLDRVIFITGGNPPHKTSAVSAADRFNMTRLAICGNSNFSDDDFEIKSCEKSYTVRTLEYLKEKYPSDELFFIIGEDSLADLEKWYMPQRILEMCTLLVFPRVSEQSLYDKIKEMSEKFRGKILPIDAPVVGISSTLIRERLEKGETIRYMSPDTVIEYIKKNHLYGA